MRCETSYPGASVRMALESCLYSKCLLLVEPNGAFSFLLLPAFSEQKGKSCCVLQAINKWK